LTHIVDVLPSRYVTYREPFLGSGSLFFLLRPERAVLSDSCLELIQTFRAVRDGAESILSHLAPLKRDKELFYEIRSHLSSDPLERAAQFIYLNKMCWNGLYRVNSKGEFNVPYGAYFNDGASAVDIARETFTSERLVVAVLDDVSRHGLRALESSYDRSRAQLVATLDKQQEILDVARRDPNEFGRQFQTTWSFVPPPPRPKTWTMERLAHALVLEGVIEDMTVGYLRNLLAQQGLALG
jgi:D12 class N6 adenine-specific DNA methyltransferase